VKLLDVEIPESMIEDEANKILTQRAIELSQYGIDVNKLLTKEIIPRMREESKPEAIEQLKKDLALKEIAQRESIVVEDSEIQEEAAKVRKELEGQTIDEERLREVLEQDLLQKKTIQWLQERAKVELVPEGSLAKPEEEEQKQEEESSEIVDTSIVEAEVISAE
jgi:trigger factor